ncbi:NAD-binding protein [Haloimpatiens sp. FM7315]|uniref:NAD-binding protein n=1 Tax=Haloimpatiens sp. FM7315 TaxID=3298609 RepID=UPI0035A26B90
MYIIIIGCGGLGSGMAKVLSSEGNDVVVVDRDVNKLEKLNEGYDGQRINGIEFDNDILNEAGINNADVFLALTQDDNINILASKIAKDIYGVKNVLARVCNFNKEIIYKSLNISTINTTKLGIDLIKNNISRNDYRFIEALDSAISIIEVPILNNKIITKEELEKKFKCNVCSYSKQNFKYNIVTKEETFKNGDKLVCAIQDGYKEELIEFFSI